LEALSAGTTTYYGLQCLIYFINRNNIVTTKLHNAEKKILDLKEEIKEQNRQNGVYLTNLKGEKRRNVGKLNNELYIVNQLVDLHFLLFVNITGN
jgi:nanoRNase/pAp phosphatase (c-di-AMP/oligoRNAs hydrolase)